MTEQERLSAFLTKWGPGGPGYGLNERQGAQQHFGELCAVLGVATPEGGNDYLFEKDTLLLGEKRGFADVFKRGHFAWEYKAPGKRSERQGIALADEARATAYGWADYSPAMPDEEVLRRLLTLNRARATAEAAQAPAPAPEKKKPRKELSEP